MKFNMVASQMAESKVITHNLLGTEHPNLQLISGLVTLYCLNLIDKCELFFDVWRLTFWKNPFGVLEHLSV